MFTAVDLAKAWNTLLLTITEEMFSDNIRLVRRREVDYSESLSHSDGHGRGGVTGSSRGASTCRGLWMDSNRVKNKDTVSGTHERCTALYTRDYDNGDEERVGGYIKMVPSDDDHDDDFIANINNPSVDIAKETFHSVLQARPRGLPTSSSSSIAATAAATAAIDSSAAVDASLLGVLIAARLRRVATNNGECVDGLLLQCNDQNEMVVEDFDAADGATSQWL